MISERITPRFEEKSQKKEGSVERLKVGEKVLRDRALEAVNSASPETLKQRTMRALLAFTLFTGASTAAARGVEYDTQGVGKDTRAEQEALWHDKNDVADFDWRDITAKIELASGTNTRNQGDATIELVPEKVTFDLENTEYFKDLSFERVIEISGAYDDAISSSYSSKEFFTQTDTLTKALDEKQKTLFLMLAGRELGKAYDFDMLNSGSAIAVSDDAMFEALRQVHYGDHFAKAGMCGNIHSFLSKTANDMGIESWVQTGATDTSGHVWTGLVLGAPGKQEIAFLDYGSLLRTGTMNYQNALGIAERYHGAVSVFDSFVGKEAQEMIPVTSLGGEVVKSVTDAPDSEKSLQENLERGVTKDRDYELSASINPEMKKVKLGVGSVALKFFDFKEQGDFAYQALSAAHGYGISGDFVHTPHTRIAGDATVINMRVKDLERSTSNVQDAMMSIFGEYIDQQELTKGEYGSLSASFGATMAILGSMHTKDSTFADGMGEASFGSRLVYVDPAQQNHFYIDATTSKRVQMNDVQAQEGVVVNANRALTLGAEIDVFEGQVLDASLTKKDVGLSNATVAKLGISGDKFGVHMTKEEKTSGVPRFIPSTESLQVGIEYTHSPQFEIDVLVGEEKEQYAGAPEKSSKQAEVKLKMVLW